jgi:hypothetical protein
MIIIIYYHRTLKKEIFLRKSLTSILRNYIRHYVYVLIYCGERHKKKMCCVSAIELPMNMNEAK